MSENDDLKERVQQFQTLRLPGQGMSMHMGTSYLVSDLWREVTKLRAENEGHKIIEAQQEAKLEEARQLLEAVSLHCDYVGRKTTMQAIDDWLAAHPEAK